MAEYFIWQGGPAGNGSSPSDSRTSIPAVSNNDILRFKNGATYAFTAQLSITATGTQWRSWDDSNPDLPIWTSTATNFGSINISNAGLTTFRTIKFLNYLSGSSNGAVMNCAVSGRASAIDVQNCWFESCRWNAIRFNGANTSEAADGITIKNNTFVDIGEDCIFGGILNGEISYNKMLSMSTRTDTGDGIGLINADPVYLWIHHNTIDHSGVDSKQCIIVDTSGAATGMCVIEDNTLIGYGSETQAPTVHTLIICDMPKIVRRNRMYAYGGAVGTAQANDQIVSNIVYIGNVDANNAPLSINANGGMVDGNTIAGATTLPATARTVVMANGVTTGSVRNNIFVNVPIAIKSDSVGNNPTATNNCFFGVTSQRLDSSGNAFSGGNDVTADPQLTGAYSPQNASVKTGGTFLGGLDYYGKEFQPGAVPIGAVQPQAAVSIGSRTVTTRTVTSRTLRDRVAMNS